MFNNFISFLKGKARKADERVFMFRIRRPPSEIAVDDLVDEELAAMNVFIVADKTRTPERLLIVETQDKTLTLAHLLVVLNDHYNLDAEYLEP